MNQLQLLKLLLLDAKAVSASFSGYQPLRILEIWKKVFLNEVGDEQTAGGANLLEQILEFVSKHASANCSHSCFSMELVELVRSLLTLFQLLARCLLLSKMCQIGWCPQAILAGLPMQQAERWKVVCPGRICPKCWNRQRISAG